MGHMSKEQESGAFRKQQELNNNGSGSEAPADGHCQHVFPLQPFEPSTDVHRGESLTYIFQGRLGGSPRVPGRIPAQAEGRGGKARGLDQTGLDGGGPECQAQVRACLPFDGQHQSIPALPVSASHPFNTPTPIPADLNGILKTFSRIIRNLIDLGSTNIFHQEQTVNVLGHGISGATTQLCLPLEHGSSPRK